MLNLEIPQIVISTMTGILILLGILSGILLSFGSRKLVLDKLAPNFVQKRLKKLRNTSKTKFFGFVKNLFSKKAQLSAHGVLWGPIALLMALSFVLPGVIPAFTVTAAITGGLVTLVKFLDRNQNLVEYVNDTTREWVKLGMVELLDEGSEESIKLLQIASRSQDEKIRNQTFHYLIENGDRTVTPLLVDGLRTGSSNLRNDLINALAQINPMSLSQQLPILLTHRTSSTRVEAFKHVHLLENETEAATHLENGLRDLDGKVRWEAAISYQKFHSRLALDWLRKFRSNPQNLRYDGAINRLEGQLNGETWQAIKAAREAMGEVNNEAQLTALLNRLLAPVDPIFPIIEQLGQLNTHESVDALVQLLGLKEVPIQRAAANTLSQLGDRARLALVEALKSKNFRKRYGAIGALGFMDNTQNIEVIIRHLNDPEPKVRQMAIRILRTIEDPRVLPEILGRTEDNSYEVRIEALGALKKIASMETIPFLLEKYKRLRKRSWESNASYKISQEMGEVGLTIGYVITRQPHKAGDYRTLLCTQCMTRAVVRKEFQWRWAVCRKCQDSKHLVGGVSVVVGQIGGPEEFTQQGNKAFVPVWDEKAKKAQFADLDALTIYGGKPMNYNWAVAAVIGALQNDTTRKNVKIPIVEHDEPELDDNTQRLIREIRANV